jgi:hypothetical protein
MNEDPIDIRQLARAIRFALVAIVLGLSYFGIRASLSIVHFAEVFKDMLGSHPLPDLTVFVIQMRLPFVAVSFAIPLLTLGSLLWRNLVGSFYLLGCLGLLGLVEFVVLYHGLSAPLFTIIQQMGGNGS